MISCRADDMSPSGESHDERGGERRATVAISSAVSSPTLNATGSPPPPPTEALTLLSPLTPTPVAQEPAPLTFITSLPSSVLPKHFVLLGWHSSADGSFKRAPTGEDEGKPYRPVFLSEVCGICLDDWDLETLEEVAPMWDELIVLFD